MAMTDEQRGFFHHCLNVSWINVGLPADPKERARVLERTRNQADARWAGAVASQFVPPHLLASNPPLLLDCYPPGYLVNARQEQERVLARQKSASAADSAKARYERSTTETRRRSSTRAYDSDSVSGVALKRGSG